MTVVLNLTIQVTNNVTNVGATILKAIQLDNAAAKILFNISKVQEFGDGTKTVTVLAEELLKKVDCAENSSSDDCGGIVGLNASFVSSSFSCTSTWQSKNNYRSNPSKI